MTNPNLGRVLEKIIGKKKEEKPEAEVGEAGEKREEAVMATPKAAGKIYLKALSLHSIDDLERIKNEVKSGNILIIKVEPLAEKSIDDVKRAVGELSEFAESIGGDIARLGEERIVLTPPSIQILKEKTSFETQ
ncbi:cell division protein SepF [Candidatus Bathyarchaeota archaeon]|nr:cell division protein SepF [Candidatus Bathyarchaeota archaeon]